MSSYQLVLYSRDDCPLCDLAAATLRTEGYTAEWVDISDSIELLGRYRDRIPVLFRSDTGAELGWPFDQAAVRAFLSDL